MQAFACRVPIPPLTSAQDVGRILQHRLQKHGVIKTLPTIPKDRLPTTRMQLETVQRIALAAIKAGEALDGSLWNMVSRSSPVMERYEYALAWATPIDQDVEEIRSVIN